MNSLVYPRLFEEAVVRHAAEREDVGGPLLARAVELRYRKPFFLGERAAITLEVEAEADRGARAIGAFSPAGEPVAKPSCTVAMRFS